MKNIFKTLLAAVTCLALIPPAESQTNQYGAYTNVTKVSALPAVSSIAGTELVLVAQGGVSRYATVNQLLAGAVGAANTFDNYFLLLQGTNQAAWYATASNGLAYTTNQFNFATAYAYAVSNQMQIEWLNEVTTRQAVNSAGSNNLNAASNVLTAAMIASNAALASAISTVAAGLGTTLTNGGTITAKNLNFTIVSLPAWNPNPSQNSGNTYTTNIDFNAGSYQSIAMTDLGQGNIDLFNPINWTSGQQVSLFVTFPNGIGSSARLYTGPFSASDYSLAFFPTTAHAAQLTWTAVGTNLFFKLTSY